MGSSSSSGVTRIEPPSYQLPYLQGGLQQAQNLYNQGPTAQYGGQTVAGFSPQQEQAFGLIENRALNGSPVTQSAQDYVTQSLQGGFMGSNPYLDATFNKAALATQNQLASQFGGAGRDVNASEGLRAQQLGDLATNIYGGAYENERNRMQGVLPYAQGLANQDYTDYGQLLGVGGQVQGLSQQILDDRAQRFANEQNAPGQSLDQYLARVRGTDYGSTQRTSQSQPNNLLGSLLGGGLLLGGLL